MVNLNLLKYGNYLQKRVYCSNKNNFINMQRKSINVMSKS